MSKAYIISYDLSEPGQNYEDVLDVIQSYPAWARLGGSTYVVLTSDSTVSIRDGLMEIMDSNDQLFVGAIHAPAAWFGLGDEVSDWLKKNLD